MVRTPGFTVIEVMIMIIIIVILAAIAIPKFLNITSNAQKATTTAIAGALSAANATNYVSKKVNTSNGVTITNCIDVTNALQGGIPSGYTITSLSIATDVSKTCTLTGPGSTTAFFTATGTGKAGGGGGGGGD